LQLFDDLILLAVGGSVVYAGPTEAVPTGKTFRWDGRVGNDIGKYGSNIPSRELTYPTLGKGKSSSKCHFWGIC